jgi:hypothetical protein
LSVRMPRVSLPPFFSFSDSTLSVGLPRLCETGNKLCSLTPLA